MSLEKLKEYSEVGKPYLFLFSGKAGVGKTTSANIMLELVNAMGAYDFRVLSFADRVKKIAEECYGWDGKKDSLGRRLLQDVGRTGRNYHKDIWVKHTYIQIRKNPAIYDFVFIDDWRYPNEFFYLRDKDEFFVSTVRVVAPDRETIKGTTLSLDSSEVSLPERTNARIYDYVIYNDTSVTIPQLKIKLFWMLTSAVIKQYSLYV